MEEKKKAPRLSNYDRKNMYEKYVEPLVVEAMRQSVIRGIPFFAASAVSSSSGAKGKTKYAYEFYATGSAGIKLFEDRFEKFICVSRGFDVVPSGYYLPSSIDRDRTDVDGKNIVKNGRKSSKRVDYDSYTIFDKTDEYHDVVDPLIDQALERARKHRIPFFCSAAFFNGLEPFEDVTKSGKLRSGLRPETHYSACYVQPADITTYLKDDYISKYIRIADGYDILPPGVDHNFVDVQKFYNDNAVMSYVDEDPVTE